MSSPLYLCLDQGGSASRALLIDATGQVLDEERVPIATTRIDPDRVEHDPVELADALTQAAAALLGRTDSDRRKLLAAAGMVTQRASLVCWDRQSGVQLSPVLSWQDTRAKSILKSCPLPVEQMQRRTGLVPNAHLGASKYRWCLDNIPAVAAAANAGRLAMGPLASWLTWRLLEEHPLLIDPANAGRTLLMNVATGQWDAELLQAFGLNAAHFPTITPTLSHYGTLHINGIRLPLQLLNGDQSSAIFGFGKRPPGCAYLNIGTGAFLSVPVPELPHTIAPLLCSPCLWTDKPLYLLEGPVHGAGAAVKWWRNDSGETPGNAEKLAALDIKDPALFINTIGGLGAPDWRDDISPRFIGNEAPLAKLAGILESILFLVMRNLEILHTRAAIDHLLLSGGLGRMDALAQKLADLTGLPVLRPQECEATALGAAWCLAGQPDDWKVMEGAETFRPEKNAAIKERYRRWTVSLKSLL